MGKSYLYLSISMGFTPPIHFSLLRDEYLSRMCELTGYIQYPKVTPTSNISYK
jgi:hypothetical protein